MRREKKRGRKYKEREREKGKRRERNRNDRIETRDGWRWKRSWRQGMELKEAQVRNYWREKKFKRERKGREREKEGEGNFPEESLRENVSWCIMSHVRDTCERRETEGRKRKEEKDLLVLLLGSLGPSTVTLIALV